MSMNFRYIYQCECEYDYKYKYEYENCQQNAKETRAPHKSPLVLFLCLLWTIYIAPDCVVLLLVFSERLDQLDGLKSRSNDPDGL